MIVSGWKCCSGGKHKDASYARDAGVRGSPSGTGTGQGRWAAAATAPAAHRYLDRRRLGGRRRHGVGVQRDRPRLRREPTLQPATNIGRSDGSGGAAVLRVFLPHGPMSRRRALGSRLAR
jgi:hypothetical protein